MKADEVLEEAGVVFEVVEQDNPTLDCDDAARERGVETSQIVKSLIIESQGELFHACIPGDRTLSEKKLGDEYRLVDPEKSKELTGFESGTVHPLSTELKHLVDQRILENDRVSFTTGERDRGVIIEPEKIVEVLESREVEVEIADFVVTEEEDLKQIELEGIGSEEASFVMENGYRKIFLESVKQENPEDALKAIRKLHRQEIEFDEEQVNEIIDRSENETHMQKLAEQLAEEGRLSEQEEFSVEDAISEVIDDNPEAMQDLRDGKDSAINYLMGKVMEETRGKADPSEAKKMIMEEV